MATNAELRDEPNPLTTARPLAEWHEDMGPKLWWKFPIEEAPYVGSPLDCGFEVAIQTEVTAATVMRPNIPVVEHLRHIHVGGWPGYHTHFTDIVVPEEPK